MSDKIIIIFAFLLLNSCNGQNDNKKNEIKSGKSVENAKIKKEITMEKFDIEKFNKHQQDNEWNYVDDEGNSVRERKDESIIFENNEYTTKTKMEGYTIKKKIQGLRGIHLETIKT